MKEYDRNKALILLLMDFVEKNETEKIDLLKTILSTDTKAMKMSFKIITGIEIEN